MEGFITVRSGVASFMRKSQHHYLAARCHQALVIVPTNKPRKPSAHTIGAIYGAPRDRA